MSTETEFLIGIASQSVEEYGAQSDEWLLDHRDLKECWECEDWLSKGIESFEMISSTELVLRTGESQGRFDFTPELQDAMLSLYDLWLKSGEAAERWIQSLDQRELSPKNLGRFQDVIAKVRQTIAEKKWRRDRINSVNDDMLKKLAARRLPPKEIFEDDYR